VLPGQVALSQAALQGTGRLVHGGGHLVHTDLAIGQHAHLGQIHAIKQTFVALIGGHGLAQVVTGQHQVTQHPNVMRLHPCADGQSWGQQARPQGCRLVQHITPNFQGDHVIWREGRQARPNGRRRQGFSVQPI
jgi:hypothetical protein